MIKILQPVNIDGWLVSTLPEIIVVEEAVLKNNRERLQSSRFPKRAVRDLKVRLSRPGPQFLCRLDHGSYAFHFCNEWK
jgi:hypothetical protein